MWEKSSSGKLPLNFQHQSLFHHQILQAKVVLTVFPTGSKMGQKWLGRREKKCTNANCPWNSVLPLFFFLLSFYFLLFLLWGRGVVVILSASNCFLKLWHKRRKETDFQDAQSLLHQNFLHYFVLESLFYSTLQLTCH